jgi:hypothetical protein
MLDFEIQRCTRHCAVSGRELKAGETVYSVVRAQGATVVREDFAAEHWHGPPDHAIGWWMCRIPTITNKRAHWAPNDVMLDLLEQLEHEPTRQEFRYVLSLLLIRRRMLRLEETRTDELGQEISLLYCAKKETSYQVVTAMPDHTRIEAIQQELGQLLTIGT